MVSHGTYREAGHRRTARTGAGGGAGKPSGHPAGRPVRRAPRRPRGGRPGRGGRRVGCARRAAPGPVRGGRRRYCHRSTVLNRIARICELTGFPPESAAARLGWPLALRALPLVKAAETSGAGFAND
ncbi:helix-turn-helix domain-containing protein [Streptomyces uncialis]|uniref:helix-turn-helix domain-containing protein n=1 Tax=Streptomyces uncialis TaxID=1048205 RepID=UPI0037B89CFE